MQTAPRAKGAGGVIGSVARIPVACLASRVNFRAAYLAVPASGMAPALLRREDPAKGPTSAKLVRNQTEGGATASLQIATAPPRWGCQPAGDADGRVLNTCRAEGAL